MLGNINYVSAMKCTDTRTKQVHIVVLLWKIIIQGKILYNAILVPCHSQHATK